jgi:hypothetical protein
MLALANWKQLDEIFRLLPGQRQRVLALVEAGLTEDQAQDILAAAREPWLADQRAGEELRQRGQAQLDRCFVEERVGREDPIARWDREVVWRGY